MQGQYPSHCAITLATWILFHLWLCCIFPHLSPASESCDHMLPGLPSLLHSISSWTARPFTWIPTHGSVETRSQARGLHLFHFGKVIHLKTTFPSILFPITNRKYLREKRKYLWESLGLQRGLRYTNLIYLGTWQCQKGLWVNKNKDI